MNYLKNNFKVYINSFRNKNLLPVLALNTTFILITAAVIKLISLFSKRYIEKVNEVDLSNILFQTESQLQATVTTLKGFVLFAIIAAILFILFLIINWSFLQGIIYNLLLKKKFTLKYFIKFLLLNIIWFIPWLILTFVIFFGAKIESFVASAYIIILLFLHFSFILYIIFTKEPKLKDIIKALKLGITRIHYFVLPYTLILITFFIVSQLNLLNISYIFIIFIFLIFFSWMQNYTKDVIVAVNKQKV